MRMKPSLFCDIFLACSPGKWRRGDLCTGRVASRCPELNLDGILSIQSANPLEKFPFGTVVRLHFAFRGKDAVSEVGEDRAIGTFFEKRRSERMSEEKGNQKHEQQMQNVEEKQAVPKSGVNKPGKGGHTFAGMESIAMKTQQSAEKGNFTAVMPPISGSTEGTGTTSSKILQRPTQSEIWEPAEKVYIDKAYEKIRLIFVGILLLPVLLWCFLPAILARGGIIESWSKPDYSHGYIIIPLVFYFLWVRMDTYPGTYKRLDWFGLIPLLLCVAARYFASLRFMDAVEQWSILLYIWGVIWLFYGTRTFMWALPSLAFLWFLFPLPYSFEVMMRQRLQIFAAQFAVLMLQTLGQPAVNIGTTIRMGVYAVGVEAACSGIRFLISFFAIGIGTILFMRRPWWFNLIIFAGVIPIALFVNAIRITLTALMIMYLGSWLQPLAKPNQSVGVVADNVAGYIAIVLAFAIFAAFVFYLSRIFRKVSLSD